MNFTDTSYFKGLLTITNIESQQTYLDALIARVEKRELVNVLGLTLYTEFMAGLEELAALLLEAEDESLARTELDEIAQQIEALTKWTELRDGALFSLLDPCSGTTFARKWIGFKNTDKESLLTDFAFYEYCVENAVTIQSVGAITPEVDNSRLVPNMRKPTDAYNNGVRRSGGIIETDLGNNLYNFIYARNLEHGEDYYANWEFEAKEYINHMNI